MSKKISIEILKKMGICSIGMVATLLSDWVMERNNEEKIKKIIRQVLAEQSKMET